MDKIKRNELLHKIIKYIPTEKIRFQNNNFPGNIEIVFTERKAIMTILKENTWDEIKRHIDNKICDIKPLECSICLSKEMQKSKVSCPICSFDTCVNCYISIFRANKGLIKCPFCRYTYGDECPDYMIEICIQEILCKVSKK